MKTVLIEVLRWSVIGIALGVILGLVTCSRAETAGSAPAKLPHTQGAY